MSYSRLLATVIVLAASGLMSLAQGGDDLLSFDERVQYQRAIEEVHWQHRIWPAANPGPKPGLDEVLSDSVIRERVATYLQKSAALGVIWSRPLTGEQLQAEMDRMVRGSKNPERLRDLFAALDDDPFLVAECLARPLLVDRLTRSWYARDERFHGALRKQAEAARAAGTADVARIPKLGGKYEEAEWRLVERGSPVGDPNADLGKSRIIDLSTEEWREQITSLAVLFGVEHGQVVSSAESTLLDRIPLGVLAPLVEENDRFKITSVLSKKPNRVRVATVTWEKLPFEAWWEAKGTTTVESTDGIDAAYPPIGGYRVHAPLDSGCVADTWTNLWYVPIGAAGHTAVWTGAEMIVWGLRGWTGGRYDPATDSWTPTSIADVAPSGRSGFTAVWTGTEMIVWGGDFQNIGGRYDPVSDTWTEMPGGLSGTPEGRDNHTAIWTGTEMIVWGGHSYYEIMPGLYDYYSLNTGGRYNPATDSWNSTSWSDAPSHRGEHTTVWTGSEMIVWGGRRYVGGGRVYSNTGGRYDPVTDSWTPTSVGTGEPDTRSGHTAVWTGSDMIIWGGYNGAYQNTGARYDPEADTWTATSTEAGVPTERSGHTAVWTGTEMIVWGGGGGGYQDTGGRYDPALDSWTPTSTGAGVPPGRRGHTAVWTGTEMIVWGGLRTQDLGSIYERTGGRYDPATDSWIPTSTGAGVPAGREEHTAVWTGAEMIVWGGNGWRLGHLNTGGRYDPATDSWTVTSIGAGVPLERDSHTAVWTGTKMIVWGGYNQHVAGYVNTGGLYDPTTDSWTPTSTGAGVPVERTDHAAVWTGTEMIVWGGSVYSNTGGRYDPATDSWTPTSTGDGVPAGRDGLTAVWTGAEMVVWGGDSGAAQGTGGRYDPVTDSWAATSTGAGTPSGRKYHTVVWTGTEMIVWGGYNEDTGYQDVGGRYDPALDSWTPPSTGAGVPTTRRDHTAVWTGTEMIVWGGYNQDTGYQDAGGSYDPAINSWTGTSAGTEMPARRRYHSAVWTGDQMIVWGGSGVSGEYQNDGGLYCACEGGTVQTWYPDADGDGYGSDWTGIPSCSQPPGYIAVGGDCDDTNPGAHTGGAPEVNDGLDNQCPGDHGYGVIDEVSGVCGFHNVADKDEFSWPAQNGATGYEVARSTDPQFGGDCLGHATSDTYWDDGTPVPVDACFHYLVRSTQPNVGSWGADSTVLERMAVCP